MKNGKYIENMIVWTFRSKNPHVAWKSRPKVVNKHLNPLSTETSLN